MFALQADCITSSRRWLDKLVWPLLKLNRLAAHGLSKSLALIFSIFRMLHCDFIFDLFKHLKSAAQQDERIWS